MTVFKCPYKCKKQCHKLSRPHKFQKRSFKKFTICKIKLGVKNIKFRLQQLQSQRPQILSKVNDSFLKTWLFPFLGHFLHALGIIAFNIKRFFTCFFVYMSQHGKIKWYMYIPSCETVHQTIHRPDWQGLLKT